MTENVKPTSEEWTAMMQQWKSAINTPHEIEERFGEYMFDYWLEVLPPKLFGSQHVLCSEPYNHTSDGATYHGIFRKDGKWYGGIFTVNSFKKLI